MGTSLSSCLASLKIFIAKNVLCMKVGHMPKFFEPWIIQDRWQCKTPSKGCSIYIGHTFFIWLQQNSMLGVFFVKTSFPKCHKNVPFHPKILPWSKALAGFRPECHHFFRRRCQFLNRKLQNYIQPKPGG